MALRRSNLPFLFFLAFIFIAPVIADSFNYELTAPEMVALNTPIEAIATTTNPDVNQVVFEWKDSDGIIRREYIDETGPYTFTDSYPLDKVGDWKVRAIFKEPKGDNEKIVNVKVVFVNVIPELPLGTIMGLAAFFSAFALMAAKKRFR